MEYDFPVDIELDAAGPPRLRDMGRIVLTGDELAERVAIELRHGGDVDRVPAVRVADWVDPEAAARKVTAAAIAKMFPPPPSPPQLSRVPFEVRARVVRRWWAEREAHPDTPYDDAIDGYCRHVRAALAVPVSRSTLMLWQKQVRQQERQGGRAA